MMHNRVRLLGRAWGASGLAVALAVLTHVVAGGHAPNLILVAVAWALGAVVALPFTTRKPGMLRLTGLLLPAQVIYHLAFGGTHVTSHHTGGHLHGADLTAALGTSAPGGGGLASGALASSMAHTEHAGLFMLVAHLVAAAVSVAAIRHVERGFDAARFLARALHHAVTRLARAVRVPRVPATRRKAWVCRTAAPSILTSLTLPGPLTRRGPPTLLAAHA
jgi:hypothetical protein